MKKTFFLFTIVLTSTWLNAQILYAPLQQFADACIQEKNAIQVENPDYNQQYKQLFDCLKAFNKIPMKDGSKVLHPSNTCISEPLDGHILFIPSFVADYMANKIPNPYSPIPPYIDNETRRSRPGEADTISIYYTNVMLCPNAIETFNYRVSAGEQQLIVIAEDDTQLSIVITSETGTSISTSTNVQESIVKHIWNEESSTKIQVTIKNTTNKHISFVIAVH